MFVSGRMDNDVTSLVYLMALCLLYYFNLSAKLNVSRIILGRCFKNLTITITTSDIYIDVSCNTTQDYVTIINE